MLPLLSFVIDKHYFPQLECLRLIMCKHISSAWCNMRNGIFLGHVYFDDENHHQQTFLKTYCSNFSRAFHTIDLVIRMIRKISKSYYNL
jgi:hypothetical protein